MDVKDLALNPAPSEPLTKQAFGIPKSNLDNSEKVTDPINLEDPVAIEVNSNDQSKDLNSSRSKINQVISVINVVADTTAELSKLVTSIGGIVEQADGKGLSDSRKQALQNEAAQLLTEIKKITNTETAGLRPLAGDTIRLEIEQEIGKTLEIIFPDHSGDSFGLENLAISRKDFIIQTQANVEEAKQRISELQKSVSDAKKQVESVLDQIEVASQNQEAANSSVRNLDQAIELAGSTKFSISANPSNALGSVGNLENQALQLLKV